MEVSLNKHMIILLNLNRCHSYEETFRQDLSNSKGECICADRYYEVVETLICDKCHKHCLKCISALVSDCIECGNEEFKYFFILGN